MSGPETRFVDAIYRRDARALEAALADGVDFAGMTPSRSWEAGDPAGVAEIVLGNWFLEDDELDGPADVEVETVADRRRLRYRFTGRNPRGPFVVEQQAFFTEGEDGRIDWMRVVCSGFRPT